MADTAPNLANAHLTALRTAIDAANAVTLHLGTRTPHAITRIVYVPPAGIQWACQCGNTGTAPTVIGLAVLATHLNPDQDTLNHNLIPRTR